MSGESPGVNPLVAIRYLNASPTNRDSAGVATPLANLAVGTEIEGFVINRTSNLQPILRTAIGDILVESELFLKTGSEVVIRVDPNVAGRARIVKVDGLSPQQYAQNIQEQPPATTTSNIVATSTATGSTQPNPTAPAIIQALFVAPSKNHPMPAAPAHMLSPTVTLPSGLSFSPESEWVGQLRQTLQQRPSLELQILARALPNLPNTPMPTTATSLPSTSLTPQPQQPASGGVTSVQTPTANTPTSPVSPPSASPLPGAQPTTPQPSPTTPTSPPAATSSPSVPATANTPTSITTQPPLPPTTPSQSSPSSSTPNTPAPLRAEAPSPAPAQLLRSSSAPELTPSILSKAVTGTVVKADTGKPILVQTAIGQFQLLNTRPIPVGSTLLFTVSTEPRTQAPVTAPLLPPNLSSAAPLMQEWETLEEVVQLLQSAYPQAATSLLNNLPQPGPKLTTTILFVLSALKGGSVRELLGSAAHTPLETQHGSLLKKFSSEWASIQNVSREPISQEWSMLLLPFWNDDKAEQLRLFIRDEAHQNTGEGEVSERFIVEVGLSEMGEMQLDGFLHGNKPNIQFDMMVRTEHEWPADIQTNLKGLFANCLETIGMKGSLNTMTGRQHFIRPLATEENVPTGEHGHTDGVIA